MSNWRDETLDKAIIRARKNGFDDPDFEGWEQMLPAVRKAAISQIVKRGGVAGIIFRRSFAKALWGSAPTEKRYGSVVTIDPFESGHLTHLQNMVIAYPELPDQDAWLRYLKEHP